MSSIQARRANRDRLPTAILLAVLLHAVVFVALELFLKFAPQREPEYTGPCSCSWKSCRSCRKPGRAAPEPRQARARPRQ